MARKNTLWQPRPHIAEALARTACAFRRDRRQCDLPTVQRELGGMVRPLRFVARRLSLPIPQFL